MKINRGLLVACIAFISGSSLLAAPDRLTEQQKKMVMREMRSAITKIIENINNQDANQTLSDDSAEQATVLQKLSVQVNEINNHCCKEAQAELVAAILRGVRAILQESGILDALVQISGQLFAQQEQLNDIQDKQHHTNHVLGHRSDQAADIDQLLTLAEINDAHLSVEEWLKTIYLKLVLCNCPIS